MSTFDRDVQQLVAFVYNSRWWSEAILPTLAAGAELRRGAMAINRTQLLLQELKHKLYLQWRLVPAETYQIPSPPAGRAYPSRSSVVWTAEVLGDTLAIQQFPDMTLAYIYNQSHARNDRLIEVIFCFERYCCTKQWGTFARNRI